MTPQRGFLPIALLCAIVASLPFLVGLPGDFIFDDIPNIVQNGTLQLSSLAPGDLLDVALYGQLSGQTRILPTLTFALNHLMGHGFDPGIFKATNVAIHAVTTLALAVLLRNLLLMAGVAQPRARWAALALALAWAIHPLQVSSVLYAVQRLQTMATLLLVLALLSYLSARRAQIDGKSGRTGWMLTGLLWVLALSCKEDAILLPAYALAMELTVLRFRAADSALARKLLHGYLLAAALGIAAYLFVVIPHYWAWDAYPGRNFSSTERLLTQGRVLCMYLWQALLPMPSHMPFYYDWLQPSRGLLQPWTTLPAWGLLLALLGVAWQLRHRRPIFSLGIFLFFAGHFVTSNVIALELAFEHRNHFPLIGLALAVGDLLALAATRLNLSTTARGAATALLLITFGVTTAVRADSWRSGLAVAQTSTEIAPTSARAWNSLCLTWFELGGGTKHDNPNLDKAIAACGKAAQVDRNSILGLTNVISFKIMQGSITPADWSHYLNQLRLVPMTSENAKAIWVILNRARDGMPVDSDRMLEAIDITQQRHPFGTIESAAIGYFITGNSQQPEKAYPYFVHAIQTAKDPSFGPAIIEELRKDGHAAMADRLEAAREVKEKHASP